MIERWYTDGAPWQETAGYARAVRFGSHIAVSGTTASSSDEAAATGSGGADRSADTYRQTLDALRRGVDAVERLGGRVADVVRTRVFLVPGCDWQAAARAHREVFDGVRPANTMLYVAALVGDDLLAEVEIDAEVTAEVGTEVIPGDTAGGVGHGKSGDGVPRSSDTDNSAAGENPASEDTLGTGASDKRSVVR